MARPERRGSVWILRIPDHMGRNIKFNKGQLTDMRTITYSIEFNFLKITL